MEQTRLHCGTLPAPRAPLAMPGLASLQLRIFTCWSHEGALPARPCWHHVCYEPRSSALGQKRARASAESKAGHITQPSFSQKPHLEPESFPPTSLQMGLDGGRTCLKIICVLQDHSLGSVLNSGTALLGLGSAQHAPDDVRVLPILPFALLPLAVHHGGIHIGWRKCVGFIQQRDHTQENGPGNQ